MTHAFHPLKGHTYRVHAVIARGSDRERVRFRDEAGYLRHIPTGWTDLASPDPFQEISGGRSPFRVVDLLALADLLSGLDPVGSPSDV